MDETLFKNNDFCMGVVVGINLYQKKILEAYERNESLMINGDLYYLQDGRERLLQEMIDKICRWLKFLYFVIGYAF